MILFIRSIDRQSLSYFALRSRNEAALCCGHHGEFSLYLYHPFSGIYQKNVADLYLTSDFTTSNQNSTAAELLHKANLYPRRLFSLNR